MLNIFKVKKDVGSLEKSFITNWVSRVENITLKTSQTKEMSSFTRLQELIVRNQIRGCNSIVKAW